MIGSFVRRIGEVEAYRFKFDEPRCGWPAWLQKRMSDGYMEERTDEKSGEVSLFMFVLSSELCPGLNPEYVWYKVHDGDYIVHEGALYYPCRPKVFETLFAPDDEIPFAGSESGCRI